MREFENINNKVRKIYNNFLQILINIDMKKAAIIATLIALGNCESKHPINEEIVAEIKSMTQDWIPYEAHENPLKDLTHEEIKGTLGTLIPEEEFIPSEEVDVSALPTNFDAR